MRNCGAAGTASLLALLVLAGCTRSPNSDVDAAPTATGVVTIYTVNYPLQYFAERIGGRHASIHFPAPSDVDPAYWRPSPEIINRYQQAELILLNGASYAQWTQTVSLPPSKLLDTSASFRDQYIRQGADITHSHGPAGEHEHLGTAFTTWLDPQLAIAQAAAVHARLVSLRPQYQAEFDQGFTDLKADLQELDAKIMAIVEQDNSRPVIFSHPVYQYFARRYNLNAQSLHWEPNEVPTEAMWEEFALLKERHPATCVIWEGQPDQAIVSRLRELQIESILFSPCGNRPAQGDYLSVMQANIDRLATAFAPPGDASN